jgi:hypothetical protein
MNHNCLQFHPINAAFGIRRKKKIIILRKHTQVAKCFSSEAAVKLFFLLNFDFFSIFILF